MNPRELGAAIGQKLTEALDKQDGAITNIYVHASKAVGEVPRVDVQFGFSAGPDEQDDDA